MRDKATFELMQDKIDRLEREIVKYVRKENALQVLKEQVGNGHTRRTISMMKIIEELQKEIKSLRKTDQDELDYIAHNLSGRVNELNTLYDISRLRSSRNFSLDQILQSVVDFVPSAIPHPQNASARILFDHYVFTTRNFKNTKWKLSKKICINNEPIGVLEICYLEKMPELDGELFFIETEKLIAAIAESIAQIMEREWAEIEIRDGHAKIDALLKSKPV
jgi:hypothetical protein